MSEFITENSVTFIVLCIIVVAIAIYAIKYRKNVLQKAALYAVSRAEEEWGSKTGQIKFAEVYTYLKKNYPFITFFISEEQLSRIIEVALDNLKVIINDKQLKDKTEVASPETKIKLTK